MGQDQSKVLQKTLFDIRFTAKQLERESKKADKKANEHKTQVKRAIEKGDRERAQICAESSLREKQQAVNLSRLATRLDAVAAKLNQAIIMNKTTKLMGKTVEGMEAAFKSMDAAKISKIMDQFEEAFTEVDVKQSVANKELDRTMESSLDRGAVDTLIEQVSEEYGVRFAQDLQSAPIKAPEIKKVSEQDELAERLRNL